MRRVFIIVLLGIISISTLSSLLSGNVHTEPEKLLLDTVVGTVGAGNFSYWHLGHLGPLIVELTSLSGDADLYIGDASSTLLRPGYEFDKNNFSSTTCGQDMVIIPADFPRPLGIGVFGHWSHAHSEFSIHVFFDNSRELTEDEIQAIERAERVDPERSVFPAPPKYKPWARKKDAEAKPQFLKLLGVLDMIFEMFVL